MPNFLDIDPVPDHLLEELGYRWGRDVDGAYLLKEKIIQLSENEALEFYKAADHLYEMYEEAAEYVIQKKLYNALDIPPSMVDLIQESWHTQRDQHLYSRFDLSGGLDGLPIKLIEFNADTPTMLLESSLLQWMLVQYNKMDDAKQANNIYEALREKFASLSQKNEQYTRFLFSSVDGIEEEIQTTKFLQRIARDAGVVENFSFMHDTDFQTDLIRDSNNVSYDYWFKLYPWEDVAFEEKELLEILHSVKTKVLNPAYTLLYQSKGMLKILYDLFPRSEYLLESSFTPLEKKHVKKPSFGREGANVEIIDKNSQVLSSRSGPYEKSKSIYQEFADFARDDEGNFYQAGVFFSTKACGLGFRKGSEIMDDMSQFVGHILTSQ